MRLSLLQIARIRGWGQTTINLIEQAIADTPSCTLDFDAEWDISLPWLKEFASLRPALIQVLLGQFGVDLRQVGHGPLEQPFTAVQRAAAPHILEYMATLSASGTAVLNTAENETYQKLAIWETEKLLERIAGLTRDAE